MHQNCSIPSKSTRYATRQSFFSEDKNRNKLKEIWKMGVHIKPFSNSITNRSEVKFKWLCLVFWNDFPAKDEQMKILQVFLSPQSHQIEWGISGSI